MKTTDTFKKTIEAELQKMASDDPLFAKSFANPDKNIDDCITYILNTVKKSGCVGFTDDEVFGMAAHYYDEADLKPGDPVSCNVVVNHTPELTEAEIEEAKKKALEQLKMEEIQRMKKRSEVKKQPEEPTQLSLL